MVCWNLGLGIQDCGFFGRAGFGLGRLIVQRTSLASQILNIPSALPLLVPGVLTDHTDDILALHDTAAFAKAFHRGSDFHGLNLGWILEDEKIALKMRKSSERSTNSLLLPEGNPAFGQVVGRHF